MMRLAATEFPATLLLPATPQLPERLAELCADGSPGCVKAAVKALVVVSGPEGAAKAAADLADRLLDRLKVGLQGLLSSVWAACVVDLLRLCSARCPMMLHSC